jgi:ABC-type transport system substrate-binding protein
LDGAPVTGNAALAQRYWQRYLAAHHNQAPEIWMNINYGHANIDMALAYIWRDILDVKVTLTAARMQALPPVSSDFQWLDLRTFIDDADPHAAFFWGPSAISGASWVALAPFGSGMPEADALLTEADGLADMQQRIPLYQQAEQLLIDNAIICPLYQRMNKYALRPWVKGGFAEDARGIFPNDAWVTGYIAKH